MKILGATIQRRRSRCLGVSLVRDRKGTAAIEFAIVAPVFLMMMFSLFEVGWFFFANSVVDASVAGAARMIKTGQLQKSGGDDGFKFDKLYDAVCDPLEALGECDERLTVEVKKYDTFAELAADNVSPVCADGSPDDIEAMPFEPGGELEIVRVRICFLYTTLNPAIGLNLAEEDTNQRRLVSTMIFRNEPYELNSKDE